MSPTSIKVLNGVYVCCGYLAAGFVSLGAGLLLLFRLRRRAVEISAKQRR